MPQDSDEDFGLGFRAGRRNQGRGLRSTSNSRSPRKMHVLNVHVLEGRRLRSKIASEGVQPFVVLRVGSYREETVPKRSSRAAWNEEFSFKVNLAGSSRLEEELVIELWNARSRSSSSRHGSNGELLGEKAVALRRIEEMFTGGEGHWFTLSNACGQIKMKFTIQGVNERYGSAKRSLSSGMQSDTGALNKIRAALRRTDSSVTVGHAATFLGRTFRKTFDRDELTQYARRQGWTSSKGLEARELFEMYSYVEEMRESKGGRGPESPRSNGFAVGDVVEARFGQGKAYYPGKITAKHRDGTYDISYDDGDTETNVSATFIKRKYSSTRRDKSISPGRTNRGRSGVTFEDEEEYFSFESTNNSESGDNIQIGQRVEARFKGGKTFYKGRITRIEGDSTYTIRYDDGDIETSVSRKFIRVLGSESQQSSAAKSDRFSVGDKISARFKGGEKYYSGELIRRNRNGTWAILYDDGDREDSVNPELIRKQPNVADSIKRNDRVEVQLRYGHRPSKGRVLQANRDGSFHIRYDTGKVEKSVDASRVSLMPASPSSHSSDDSYLGTRKHAGHANRHRSRSESGKAGTPRSRSRSRTRGDFCIDDKVRFKSGKGRKNKRLRVSRVHTDGSYDVVQDNGKVFKRVEQAELRQVETSSSEDIDAEARSRFRSRRKSDPRSNITSNLYSESSESSLDGLGRSTSRRRARKKGDKEASVWAALRKVAVQEGRDPPALHDVLAEANEERRMESVLGKRRVRELRRAFNKYDRNGDGVITAVEVKKTLLEMGAEVNNRDIREWVHRRDLNRDGVIDFVEFLDAYAAVSVKAEELDSSSSNRYSQEEESDFEGSVDLTSREKWRQESWAIDLGPAMLKRLKRVFLENCVSRRSGEKVLHIKHLRRCLAVINGVCSIGMVTDYMNVMGFSKSDVLAFREFAHAYHWLFHASQDSQRLETPARLESRIYLPDRGREGMPYGKLSKEAEGSIGEIAARVYQSGEFTGTREEHAALLRVLMVGRLPEEVRALKRLFSAFEQADHDEDGEVETGDIVGVLRNAEINPAPLKHTLAAFTSQRRATTLPELLVAIGFALSKQHLAVPECFAILRLHHPLDVVREIGNYVIKALSRILENPADTQRWDMSATSAGFKATLSSRKGGISLLNACGFIEAPSKRWFRLVAASKGQSTLKEAELSQLSLRREEVLKELSLLDGGTLPLPDALRLMNCTDLQAVEALQLASSIIVKVLKHPKDPRHWRVRRADPRVAAVFGGFKTENAAKHLFEAIYFQASADNKTFVLQHGREELDPHRPFSFPEVDDDLEKALWRRKAEVDSMLRELETRIAKGGTKVFQTPFRTPKTRPRSSLLRERQRSGDVMRSVNQDKENRKSTVDVEALAQVLKGEGADRVQDPLLKGVGLVRLLNSAELAQVGAEKMISFTVSKCQGQTEKQLTVRASVVDAALKRYNGFKPFLEGLGWKYDALKNMYSLETKRVLRRLKQLEPHVLALGIPMVEDERAVRAALVSLPKHEKPRLQTCIETLVVYLENILDRPHEASFRTINCRNVNFRRRVASCSQGILIMVACGFRETTDGKLVFPSSASLSLAEAKLKELRKACSFLSVSRTKQANEIVEPTPEGETPTTKEKVRKKELGAANAKLEAAKHRIRTLEKQVSALRERPAVLEAEQGKATRRLEQDLLPCKIVPWSEPMRWQGPAKLEICQETRLVVSVKPDCLILDCPLTRPYPRGTLMKLVKPLKNEMNALNHRNAAHFIRSELLEDVVHKALQLVSVSKKPLGGFMVDMKCVGGWELQMEESKVIKVEREAIWTCMVTDKVLIWYADSCLYWNIRFLFSCMDRSGIGQVAVKDLVNAARHRTNPNKTLSPVMPLLKAMIPERTLGWNEYLSLFFPDAPKVAAKEPLEQAMEACYYLVQSAKGFDLTMYDLAAVSSLLDGEQVSHGAEDEERPMSLAEFKRQRRDLGKVRAARFNSSSSIRVRQLLASGYGLIDIAICINLSQGDSSVAGNSLQRQELEEKALSACPPRWVSRLEFGCGFGRQAREAVRDLHVIGRLDRAYVLTSQTLYCVDLVSQSLACSVAASGDMTCSSLGLLVLAGKDGSVRIHDPLTLAVVQRFNLSNSGRIRGVYMSVYAPVVTVATDTGFTMVDRNGIALRCFEEVSTVAAVVEEQKCVAFVDGKNCLKTISFAGLFDVVNLVKTLLDNRDAGLIELSQLDELQLPLLREDIARIQRCSERLEASVGLNGEALGEALVSQLAKLDTSTGHVLRDVLSEWQDGGFDAELKRVVEQVLGIWLTEAEMDAIAQVCNFKASRLAKCLVEPGPNPATKQADIVDDLEHGARVSDLAFIQETQLLAVISGDGGLRLYSKATTRRNTPVLSAYSTASKAEQVKLELVYKTQAVKILCPATVRLNTCVVHGFRRTRVSIKENGDLQRFNGTRDVMGSTTIVYVLSGCEQVIAVAVSGKSLDRNWVTLEHEAALVLDGYPVYTVYLLARAKARVVRVFVISSTDANACAVARSALERNGLSRCKLREIRQCLRGVNVDGFYAVGDGPDRDLDLVETSGGLNLGVHRQRRICQVEVVVTAPSSGQLDVSVTRISLYGTGPGPRESRIETNPVFVEKRRVETIAVDLLWKALNEPGNTQHLRLLFDLLCISPDHWGPRYTHSLQAQWLLRERESEGRPSDWLFEYLGVSTDSGIAVKQPGVIGGEKAVDVLTQRYASSLSFEEVSQFLSMFGMFIPRVSPEQRLDKDVFVERVSSLISESPFKGGLEELRGLVNQSTKEVNGALFTAGGLSVLVAERAHVVGKLFRLNKGLHDELCRLTLGGLLEASRSIGSVGLGHIPVKLQEVTKDVVVVELDKLKSLKAGISVGIGRMNGKGEGFRCEVCGDEEVKSIAMILRKSPFSRMFPRVFARAVLVGDETNSVEPVVVEQGIGWTLADVLKQHGPASDDEVRPLLYCWLKQLLEIVVALRTEGLYARRLGLDDVEVSAEGTALRLRSLGRLERSDGDNGEDYLVRMMLACMLGPKPLDMSFLPLFESVRRDSETSVDELCGCLEELHNSPRDKVVGEKHSRLRTLLILHGLAARSISAEDVLESGIFKAAWEHAVTSAEIYLNREFVDIHSLVVQVMKTPKPSIVLHALRQLGESKVGFPDLCLSLYVMREHVLLTLRKSNAILSTLASTVWSIARRAPAGGIVYLLEATLFWYAKGLANAGEVDVEVETTLRPLIEKLCSLSQAEEVVKAATSYVQGISALYKDDEDHEVCDSVFFPSAEYIQMLVALGANLVALAVSHRSQKRVTAAARQVLEILLTSFQSSIAGLEADRAVTQLSVVNIVAGWIHSKGSLRTMTLECLEHAYAEVDRQGGAKAGQLLAFASPGVVGRFSSILQNGQLAERIAVQAIIKSQCQYPMLSVYLKSAGLSGESRSSDVGEGNAGKMLLPLVPQGNVDRDLVKVLTQLKEAVTAEEMGEAIEGLHAFVTRIEGSALMDAALLHAWSCTFPSLLRVCMEESIRSEVKTKRASIKTMRKIVSLGRAAMDDTNKLSSLVCEGGAADCFSQVVAADLSDLDADLARFFAKLCSKDVGKLRKKQALEVFRTLANKQRRGDLTLLQALVELWTSLIKNSNATLDLGDALEELLWRVGKSNGFKETLVLGVLRVVGIEQQACPALVDRLASCIRKEASTMKRNIGDFEWNVLHALAEFEADALKVALREAFGVPVHLVEGRQHNGVVEAVEWLQWSKSFKH